MYTIQLASTMSGKVYKEDNCLSYKLLQYWAKPALTLRILRILLQEKRERRQEIMS